MTVTNFQGLTVLTLESRRGQEMSRLIETYGGKALHAPAMREIPLSSNVEALKFADALFECFRMCWKARILPRNFMRR